MSEEFDDEDSRLRRAFDAVKGILTGKDDQQSTGDPYPTTNRNYEPGEDNSVNEDAKKLPDIPSPPQQDDGENGSKSDAQAPNGVHSSESSGEKSDQKDGGPSQSATESAASKTDPKEKRKDMKHIKRDGGGREVTDPVTHLPVVIRDSTPRDLKSAPENEPAPGTESKTYTGLNGASKSRGQLDKEKGEIDEGSKGMEKLFPPPNFEDAKAELKRTYQFALTVGLGSTIVLVLLVVVILQLLGLRQQGQQSLEENKGTRLFAPLVVAAVPSAIVGLALLFGIRGWLGKKVEEIWENDVWEAARQQEIESNDDSEHLPESVVWLNSLLASVWPLINPDLFTSLADTLEDVMQASLPKLIRMISVDDLGQGSESIRILGIRWLPTGAASQTVDEDGNLQSAKDSQNKNDRNAQGEGQIQDHADEQKDSNDEKTPRSKEDEQKQQEAEQEKEAIREGLEAEQGDFVNMELAFAYRARSSGKSLKTKAHNAHLYLRFYFPGGIAIPVWVELRGIIGTMRLRLQQTPDPPFFSLCTLTFLGQPKADLSCVPLSKHNLNIMDVPLISGFVQSAVDAALAEYVAPKSLTLDLKDMLVGDDFKKNTNARGVVVVFIKSAKDFKEGDGGIGPLKGSSDSYVTVSWGKFGKPMSSTRIIVGDQRPRWDEWSYLLVGPEELNAEEKLRLQLWDSDKFTADDDLGRVEIDLKELMHSPKTRNKMCDREDRFTGEDPEETMPGTVQWAVGYFAKTRITDEQFAKQTEDPSIHSKDDLKKATAKTAERKLREATIKDESRELAQQKTQDYKQREDALVISAPPDEAYPSGIFSIQIHNVTGLEIEQLRRRDSAGKTGGADGEGDGGEHNDKDDLPSSYCTVILNHATVYRTRTKPKNSKPFFNAGTERFVKDWKSAEVIVAVRDSRESENDALLGLLYLPLAKVFEKRSQINETYPLAGGIGYGHIRVSMVWRSTELHAPKELLGWDYGTLEIKTPVKSGGNLSGDLKGLRLKLRSNIAMAKLHTGNDGGEWTPKHSDKKSAFLAVRKRYACPITIEFRKSSLGPDSTPAFAVFWLNELVDEQEKTVRLTVWKGGKEALKRAKSCAGYNGLGELKQKQNEDDGHSDNKEAGETEKLGEIEVTMKFWHGLSGWHDKWAQGNSGGDASLVMEALEVVADFEADGEGGSDDEDNSSDSDSSLDQPSDRAKDQDQDHGGIKGTVLSAKAAVISTVVDSHNDADDGSRGVVAQMRDYKDHRKQLHRKHRGLMQWRGARNLEWAAGKVEKATGK